MHDHPSRRRVLASTALLSAATIAPVAAANRPPDQSIRLFSMPTRLFKTADAGHEHTESWVFWLFVETDAPLALQAQALQLQLLSGKTVVRTTTYGIEGTRALTITPPLTPKRLDGTMPLTSIYWPQAVRVRCTEPVAARIDAIAAALELDNGGRRVRVQFAAPLEIYEQRTSLIYPFKGKAVVTQGGVTNGGHRNRSGQFAIDAVGLDDGYGVNIPGGGRKSTDYAGWGRTLIAPADGIVVRARADRPDQPDPENSDPKFYAPEYPKGGDPGNHLVIDHGNSEFSMMAHFQAGSMLVKIGDPVTQGQALGKLGSSGDTNTPHSHYQLQSGPDWEWSDGLPCRFSNVAETAFVRGTFFEAK
jgi:hypothetical protein